MATNTIPYVQNTDKWVSYFLNMAEKGTVDPRMGYSLSNGSKLYPIEDSNVVFREKDEDEAKSHENVTVELVSPVQQTDQQLKQEVKEIKEMPKGDQPEQPAISVPKERKTLIRQRVGSRSTSLVLKPWDQLSYSRIK